MTNDDSRLLPLLDMLLRDSTGDGEREAVRLATNRVLRGRALPEALAGVVGGARARPARREGDAEAGRTAGLVARLRAENERLAAEAAELRERMRALAHDAHAAWIAAGAQGEPPPPRPDGTYPYAVLRAVCAARLGGAATGWQAALAVAVAEATGEEFRPGRVEDWQRSRRGVPERYVRAALDAPRFAAPAPRRWTRSERREVEGMIAAGMSDTTIVAALRGRDLEVTSEAVRGVRRAAAAPMAEAV